MNTLTILDTFVDFFESMAGGLVILIVLTVCCVGILRKITKLSSEDTKRIESETQEMFERRFPPKGGDNKEQD